jgi:hypothetical protein
MTDELSRPGSVKVLRLYADALGESRFETTTMPLALKEFAPPAPPFRVSAAIPNLKRSQHVCDADHHAKRG